MGQRREDEAVVNSSELARLSHAARAAVNSLETLAVTGVNVEAVKVAARWARRVTPPRGVGVGE